ncbi:phenylalanyl-tRNA synthetase, beta subunit [Dinoroseobacter shibae DFL 12 = DSM 16493]|jgi:phenylalanyl-tRNA synthetase beta chain|uniref:Phenylalanine--tRNA ligase beta subunit n=1 Tax=Dinoroseobacter shibae (strain DSM 16493 / NCIMB 14021 / DFL 12) TaxID=398580 RepID=A8LLH6_DINSH|nr:phenylalanine--tRNA ligase subunit beta [Dinoroseobacter shibae]ABV91986.1 phenylalanyl-tRNA synthetase, beta subunit [Dinoroseobacter shibae DFL 12 = DSM 16493]URF46956.1 phenylalanine--tRNA ligase subunit beta [Dinoroseobacter shibae]URF51267.1 phenylalanine--tRNA ligase subunit beta [Dinoroseobacter shibae]
MKFTLSWLKDHLETDATLDEILYALTDLGLEVEGVENPAAKLSDFVVGKVLRAEKHPEADRLKVCQVEYGDGPVQIICGAPNAREGITVVVARPGVYVPGIDTTIGVGKIRGIESHGMMASERELEMSDEHTGIIELPEGEIGQSFPDWLAVYDPARVDPVIEIAITPNRPDALGVRGIARDLAARGLGTMKARDVAPVPGAFPCPITVTIDDDTRDAAPVFYGRLIRGVKNGPSPDWLQTALRAIGLRPISTLVDITNFFTYDRNRPLHVFDADKVAGCLRVHAAKGGETFTGLDEKEYVLAPGMTAISDDNGVESLAGIMGGLHSGCTEETVNVFVEAAYFDPVRTAYTGRALKINSDARYRFERGIDPAWTPEGMEHATRMILDLCGGEASDVVVAGALPDVARAYKLDTDRVQSLVGMDIAPETQRATLEALGFTLEGDMAHVPSWRPDVMGEADLVEEVARIASLTKLQGRPLPRASTGVPKPVVTQGQRRQALARRTAAALGYNECVTYSFIDQPTAALFGGGTEATELENPISSEMSHMRPALLPGLMQAASRNQARGIMDLALFEVGPAFHGGEPGEQHTLISGLLVGRTGPKDVRGESRPVDVFDVKADAEAILAAIGAPAKVQILRGAQGWWHPGRHGKICLGPKKVLGVFGELHPRVVAAMDLKGPVMGFTLWPDEVPMPRKTSATRPALEARDLQAVERDFAFVVDAQVEALALTNAAAGADKTLIEEVRVFDEFIGGALGEGKKSLAITVRLQPTDATLTEKEIEAVAARIVAKVEKATGGVLRG